LCGGLLDLLDGFFPASGSHGELVFELGFLAVHLLLLIGLEAFNSLLNFLVVCLCFLLVFILERRDTGELVLNLGFLGVELVLGLFCLRLDDLLHLLIVCLALFLDSVKLLDETLLSVGVLLGQLTLNFFLLGSFLGRLAFSD
jgi:hypothetical protein